MIKTNHDADRRMTLMTALAERLLDSTDMLELFELLAPFLTELDRIDLAAMIELCPIHFCDINICIDDEITSCADYH